MGRVRTWIRNIFCRLLEKNAGYLTIELTIIFPAIFFSLLLAKRYEEHAQSSLEMLEHAELLLDKPGQKDMF